MVFRLKRGESEDKGVRRVAHGRAEDAVRLLRDEDADPIEVVHAAPKDLKKLRATLKLVRPVLGDDWYRRENERFRGAGQALSNVRDAQVRAQTVEALAERLGDDPPPGGWWASDRRVRVGEVAGERRLGVGPGSTTRRASPRSSARWRRKAAIASYPLVLERLTLQPLWRCCG